MYTTYSGSMATIVGHIIATEGFLNGDHCAMQLEIVFSLFKTLFAHNMMEVKVLIKSIL